MASIAKRVDGRWRARYRDDAGKEHARHFPRKIDAQHWLDEVTASRVTGTYVSPKTARMTVGEWCDTWLGGYATRRPSTVRQARVHIAQIKAEFGPMKVTVVRPAHVKSFNCPAACREPLGVLRLRTARPPLADHERRRARRDNPAVTVLPPDIAGAGEAAAVRGND